jgi:hypothetical protein
LRTVEHEMTGCRRRREEFTVAGGEILSGLLALLRAVTTRGIALKTRSGRVFLRIPLWLVVAAFILLPVWCIAALLLALALRLRIAMERTDSPPGETALDVSPH